MTLGILLLFCTVSSILMLIKSMQTPREIHIRDRKQHPVVCLSVGYDRLIFCNTELPNLNGKKLEIYGVKLYL